MENVKVVLYGVGSLGRIVARKLLDKQSTDIVGAIERVNVGKDLGEVLGDTQRLGVILTDNPGQIFSEANADLVIHMTGSFLEDVYPQIVLCIKAGMHVISTCEELSYPYYKNRRLANRIDELAKKHDVTVLGTGINPGFIMDTLPITLTGPCEKVDRINVTRMMYSGNRRFSYQRKIGTGLSIEEFKRLVNEGKISGHVGLTESIAMIAAALGLELDSIEETPPEAVISDEEIETSCITIKKRHVAGLRSKAYGMVNENRVIILEFISHANVGEPYDAISIRGKPDIYMKIEGGIHGDVGTASMLINSIPKVLNARAGLLTMINLPPPSCWLGGT